MIIEYLPEAKAVDLSPAPGQAMISITDAGRSADLKPGWERLLRVQFNDAWYDERDILRHGAQARERLRNRLQEEDAARIVAFIEEVREARFLALYIHCHGGACRSHAVARFAAERIGVPFQGRHPSFSLFVYEMLHNPSRYRAAWDQVERYANAAGSRSAWRGLVGRIFGKRP